MSQDYRKLEAEMLALVTSLDGVFTDQEAQEVRRFIDVGEYGVAFETLRAIVQDERKTISESTAAHLVRLAQQMCIEGNE
jgi:hypothetical protein